MTTAAPYHVSSRFYDQYLAPQRLALEERIAALAVDRSCRTCCDFACGTGSLLAELAAKGLAVSGCDISPAMLHLARKTTGIGDDALLAVADMRQFRPPWPVDLATCNYDSLNYLLTLQDWNAFFLNVFASLSPGGAFVFDVITQFDLEECWPSHRSVVEADDFVCVRTANYDTATGIGYEDMTWFLWGEDGWRICVERHEHSAFPLEEILESLERAGFKRIRAIDGDTNGELRDDTQRIQLYAERPSSPSGRVDLEAAFHPEASK